MRSNVDYPIRTRACPLSDCFLVRRNGVWVMINIVIIFWHRLKNAFAKKVVWSKATYFQIIHSNSAWVFLLEWIFCKEPIWTINAFSVIRSVPRTLYGTWSFILALDKRVHGHKESWLHTSMFLLGLKVRLTHELLLSPGRISFTCT